MTMIHFTKSLRFKVTLLVITVELLIFSGVGVFYTHRFSQEIDNAIIARLSIPGLLMTRGELSFDAVSDKRTMEGLLREPYSEGIVIGLDGHVFFSSNPARLDTHLDAIDGLRLPGPESSTFSVDAPNLITPVQDSTGIYLTSLSPLRPDGKLTGYLYLKVGTGISEAEKRKIAILFAIGSLGTIALTVPILSWLLHLMVIRRLNYLVEIFRRFALGDYAARAQPLGGDDEIVTLMNGFNGLAKRLEDTMAHLSESESRFRVLVEHAPEAILVYDVDTKHFVDANQNAERLFACSREQLRLASSTTLYAPVQTDKMPAEQGVDEYLRRALAGEEVVVERAITNARGQQSLCEVRLVLLPASNRRLIRASYLDITERKLAEEELRRLTLFQRTILDNAAYGIISASPDGIVSSFNPAAERLLGYTADEVVGKQTPASWHDPEEIARRALSLSEELGETIPPGFDLFAARPRRNLPEENEWTFIRKDGTRVPVLLSVTALRDESGRITGFVGLTYDLTERKQMVEALREGEAFLNTLLNAIPIPVFYKDRDGRYLGFNRAYETFFGATRDQLIGKTVFDISPRELAESYRAKDTELFESGGVQQYESQVKNTHDVLRDIIFNKAVFTDSQGTIIGLIGAILDITERKRAEQERLAHLRFFESMDKVNRAIQGANDLETMMKDVLDEMLAIFECDRAYLMYPCDPEAESWVIPMERTTPDYPGAKALGVDLSKDAEVAGKLRLLLSSDGPVNMGPGTPYMLSGTTAEHFNIKSMMAMAVYPKVGKPWEFGIHHCSCDRVWNPEEERLFKEIGRRLADALTSLLAHRDLLESEAKYRRIVDTANEGIWVIGPDISTTSVNARMAEMLGYPCEEMIGRSFTDFMFEEDIPDHLLQIENRRQGKAGQYERRFRRSDGLTVWTLASASPLLDEQRHFEGSFAMFTDITDRKQTEKRLNEQLHFLQQLLDSVPIPVYYKDVNELYLGCNLAFETLIGVPRSDLVGKTAYEIAPQERADMHHEADLALLRQTGIQMYEVRGIYNDGKSHDLIFNKATFVDEDNRVAGIVGASIDITDRKRAEEEVHKLNEELEQRVRERTADLNKRSVELSESQGALMNIVEDLNEKTGELERANSRLQELDRLKSMFIASMSHELRTPLNSVIGFSSVVLNEWVGPVNAEQKENLAIILRSGKHLLNLINDVIDVSKIEAGKIESTPEEFDLRDLVSEAVSLVKKELEEKGLLLRVTSPSQLIFSDRQRLLQCVLNLLSNAVKFTEQGGVTVETRIVRSPGAAPESGFVEISVTDTGIGIREEDVGKMFQPFVRLSSPLQATIPGTGLGLYLTRKLAAEVLKGDILLTSEYGKGSRFTIKIPGGAP